MSLKEIYSLEKLKNKYNKKILNKKIHKIY